MSTLKEKLNELEGSRIRDHILENFSGKFKRELAASPFSSSPRAEYFTAYPKQRGNKVEASRNNLSNWNSMSCQDLEQVKRKMAALDIPKQTLGWLSFESSTPNFYVRGLSLQIYFNEIAEYLISRDDFDIKWTGEAIDCGFIIEQYNQKGNFEFSWWGF